MRQKRFQGSHLANDEQAAVFNRIVVDGRATPACRVFPLWRSARPAEGLTDLPEQPPLGDRSQ
jgi:hypothetical protein